MIKYDLNLKKSVSLHSTFRYFQVDYSSITEDGNYNRSSETLRLNQIFSFTNELPHYLILLEMTY